MDYESMHKERLLGGAREFAPAIQGNGRQPI